MALFSTLFISVLLTIATIPALIQLAGRLHLLDIPDERKTHASPIPRCGGIAMAVGAFVPMLYWYSDSPFMVSFLAAAGVIVFFGIIDDRINLRPRYKLFGQIVAAVIAVVWGGVKIVSLGVLLHEGVLLPIGIAVPLTVLVLVGVTNAVNLSDGLDGLAGGISLLNVCFIGYLAFVTGNLEIALACMAMIGAIFGFLRFNTYPAKIFMGDSGSQFLGFAAVTFALVLTQRVAVVSPLLPLLLFGLPVLDTLTVMTKRIMDGRSVCSSDKEHLHHRLMGLGLSHAEAVLAIYLLQALLVLLSFVLRFQNGWVILSVYLTFCLLLLGFLDQLGRAGRLERRWQLFGRLNIWFKGVQQRRRIQAISCPLFKYMFYLLIFLSSLLPANLDHLAAVLLAAIGCLLVLISRLRREVLVRITRVVFYLLIPFAVYSGNYNVFLEPGSPADRLLSLSFILLLAASIVISVFSTRRKGIWSTPLDFLVLLLMLILPNLAGMNVHSQRLGLVGLKCMVFIISFEVLAAETRGRIDGMTVVTVVSLFVFALKSFFF